MMQKISVLSFPSTPSKILSLKFYHSGRKRTSSQSSAFPQQFATGVGNLKDNLIYLVNASLLALSFNMN